MDHQFFALPNLVSDQCTPCVPWQFSKPVPDGVAGKENKKARDKWISDCTTSWQVYSAIEGINPNIRVSEAKGGNEGNQPIKIHSFVADIDAPVSEDELAAGIARLCELVPNYYERTLSGNARLLWLFEKPVLVPNSKFATEFLRLALQRGRFEQVAAALDKPAWESPNRYWTNSGEWRVIDADRRVPYSLLQGWLVETSEKHAWKKDRGSLEIPLPVVWEELKKKYSTVEQSWPGDFVEGAQGPSFWVQGSVSPKSAIVKTTGIYTFAAHAHKPFFSWADLLGKDWCDRYATELLGKAVEDIYHDGRQYWRKDGHGEWKSFTKEDIALYLTTTRGLSTVKDGGMPSEVNRALAYVQEWHSIIGAAPFAFTPPGIIVRDGKRILNTHTRKVLTPANSRAKWGPDGQFPFISMFLENFFHPQSNPGNPLDYFLPWLARFYRSAYELNIEAGQNMILLGGTGVGKSLWNQFIVPRLMGGFAEAQQYLTGETGFNSQLFEVVWWTVDDTTASLNDQVRRKYSAILKRMAANTAFEHHEKFRTPVIVNWSGRVCITGNCDELSAAIVPELGIGILDKLSLYRIVDTPFVKFPPRRTLEAMIMDELPWFARFLLDYECPQEFEGSARYGVKSYHELSILRMADSSSSTASFSEILDEWRRGWFADHPTEKNWVGNSIQLSVALHANEALERAVLRGMTPKQLLTNLSALKAKNVPWLHTLDGKAGKAWVIDRPSSEPTIELPVGWNNTK